MTDPTLVTQPANTPLPLDFIVGGGMEVEGTEVNIGAVPPNAVPPYPGQGVGAAANQQSLLVLASTGAYRLSNLLNGGGLTGPHAPLSGLATGAIAHSAVP